jgi:endonuclease G
MKYLSLFIFVPLLFGFIGETKAPSSKYKPIKLDPSYEHVKWGISPSDITYEFAAYTASFDSDDDNNGDGTADIWGIPEWVSFEIKRQEEPKKTTYTRPSPWLSDDKLHEAGIVPADESYHVKGISNLKIVKGNYRFVRGHMCPKHTADRLTEDAGYNTHTTLNCVPQLQWQNNGVWKKLEKNCTDYADKYERVWVVCGPVFYGNNPALWLGQQGEMQVAVPDALFKIVIRENAESETGVETMAFVIPNIVPTDKKDVAEFLTSIENVESMTGLTFLTTLDTVQQKAEKQKNEALRVKLQSYKKSVNEPAFEKAQKFIGTW